MVNLFLYTYFTMKPASLSILLLSFCSSIFGQSLHQITIDINPVAIENGRYYFNGKRVSFDALMLPLLSVDDEKVNRHIKTIQVIQDGRKLLHAGTLLYILLSAPGQQSFSSNFDQTRNTIFAALSAAFLLHLTEKMYKNKAVKRFNSVVLSPKAWSYPDNSIYVGLCLRF